METLISIGKVAAICGVTIQTVRNWSKRGQLKEYRTIGGHRRYNQEEVKPILGIEDQVRSTIIYSRVSSYDQREDLKRQTEKLKNYCREKKISRVETIEDIGSGLNYQKKGLKKLIRKVLNNEVSRVIVNYKDRLVRFGLDILKEIFKHSKVELLVLNEEAEKTFETELVEDVLAILTVFTSKIYGKRSHSRKN